MIDMYAPLQTVPGDGSPSRHVGRHHRCWPNQVSGEYCALIPSADGSDRDEEHWYDDEGHPVREGSPILRNVAVRPDAEALKAAFAAGAASGGGTVDERFEAWFATQPAV